jgi:exonuclease III
MAARALNILSFNLAGGTLFLHHLLSVERSDLLLVQEVLLSSQDLLLKVNPYGYNCESNLNVLNPTKPGTAVIWWEGVPVTETRVLVEGRLQSVTVGAVTFLNVYAPSGSAKKKEREPQKYHP